MKQHDMNEAYRRLVEHDIRPSIQRLAILDYLLTHNVHPTVETVYTALVKKISTLSVTTVYNTLRMFAEKGVAQMVTIDEHRVCYDGFVHPHVHFFCKQCGRVLDVEGAEAPVAGKDMTVEGGHHVDEAQLYYRGVCSDCLNRRRSS